MIRKIIALAAVSLVLFAVRFSVFAVGGSAFANGSSFATGSSFAPFYKYVPQVKPALTVSLKIDSAGQKSAEQLAGFFMSRNPDGDRDKVERLAKFYVEEGAAEGINSDIAFVQMCLETGYLKFGGLVTEDMNNFCGLGAMDAEHRGNVLETEQLGVRAHIQHLHAYGTTRELVNECIDNRYKYVKPRGKAATVFGLAGYMIV